MAFQGLVSGHKSLITTLHVGCPELLLSRLTQLTEGSGIDWGKVFKIVEPVAIFLKRGAPHRIEGLFRFSDSSFRALG